MVTFHWLDGVGGSQGSFAAPDRGKNTLSNADHGVECKCKAEMQGHSRIETVMQAAAGSDVSQI